MMPPLAIWQRDDRAKNHLLEFADLREQIGFDAYQTGKANELSKRASRPVRRMTTCVANF